MPYLIQLNYLDKEKKLSTCQTCDANNSCRLKHLSFFCPCIECLIVSMCDTACEEWRDWYEENKKHHYQYVRGRREGETFNI
jgi:hypothetical protein